MSLRIGKISVDPGAWLAPMASVSTYAFRTLCLEQGCACTVTEMVSSEALLRVPDKVQAKMRRAEGERVLVVQLFGAKPEVMAEAARLVVDAGADIVDVNMGCPVKKILRTGAGAALMRDPERAARIVAAMVEAVGDRAPVTVKMRAGWDGEINAVEVARRVVDAGASGVTVHARTREQFHGGQPNWAILAQVKQAVDVPVIGNGGLQSPRQAAELLESTGCDAVMIGRGAMGNPWIFRSIRQGDVYVPSLRERFDTILRHLDLQETETTVPPRSLALEMRKHLAWYLRGLAGSAFIRNELQHLETIGQMRQMVRAYYQRLQHREQPAPSED